MTKSSGKNKQVYSGKNKQAHSGKNEPAQNIDNTLGSKGDLSLEPQLTEALGYQADKDLINELLNGPEFLDYLRSLDADSPAFIPPTGAPVTEPPMVPSFKPTSRPTKQSVEPTVVPTKRSVEPTVMPTKQSVEPTVDKTNRPTKQPANGFYPTYNPTTGKPYWPSFGPTAAGLDQPTYGPTPLEQNSFAPSLPAILGQDGKDKDLNDFEIGGIVTGFLLFCGVPIAALLCYRFGRGKANEVDDNSNDSTEFGKSNEADDNSNDSTEFGKSDEVDDNSGNSIEMTTYYPFRDVNHSIFAPKKAEEIAPIYDPVKTKSDDMVGFPTVPDDNSNYDQGNSLGYVLGDNPVGSSVGDGDEKNASESGADEGVARSVNMHEFSCIGNIPSTSPVPTEGSAWSLDSDELGGQDIIKRESFSL